MKHKEARDKGLRVGGKVSWSYKFLKEQAEVAELADAHGSGPCGGNSMGVQIPPSAPHYSS